jgi:hypothetical protein
MKSDIGFWVLRAARHLGILGEVNPFVLREVLIERDIYIYWWLDGEDVFAVE